MMAGTMLFGISPWGLELSSHWPGFSYSLLSTSQTITADSLAMS